MEPMRIKYDMTHEEFNEVKEISLETKASGKSKVITTTSIAITRPLKGATIVQ